MFSNAAFWVDISLLILVLGCVWLGVHKKILAALDARSESIRSELDQARQLREDANALLAKYQRQKKEAEDQAQVILDNARRDAQAQLEQAKSDIEARTQARIRAVEQKIANSQSEIIRDLRHQAIDMAFAALRHVAYEKFDEKQAKEQNSLSIKNLEGRLH